MRNCKLLWSLFSSFFKIGLFTFGGGYAMIPLIQNECAERKKWIQHDELMDIIIIAESTPGPISVNCATYVGYKQARLSGAVWATLGLVIPSFAVIYILSLFFSNILEITVIANAFKGIKIAVGILIFNVGFKLFRKMERIKQPVIIFSCSLLASLAIHFLNLDFSSIHIILIAGLAGYVIYFVSQRKNSGGGADQ